MDSDDSDPARPKVVKPAVFSTGRGRLSPEEIELLRQEVKRVEEEVRRLIADDAAKKQTG